MNTAQRKRVAGLHKLSVYTVIAIAFMCVAFGGGVGPIMAAVFVLALVVSWFVDSAGLLDESFAKWWNALILGFVGLTAAQIFLSDESIISAAIRFVLLLAVVKLFGRFNHKDDLQLYALSFLIFAAATAVNEGVTYGILFGLYVIAGTFSLALFHLNMELGGRPSLRASERTPFDRQYMAVLGAISAVIFVSSVGIFFTFPRVGLGFFVSQQREQVSVTGFSESVELGSHGVVRDNPEVVMRVEFPGGRPSDYATIHWRTMTFDQYDGKSWSQTLSDTERSLPREGERYIIRGKNRDIFADGSGEGGFRTLEIYLEPMGTNLLPTLWPTVDMKFGNDDLAIPWNPRSGGLTVDAYGDVRHTVESEIGVPYTLRALPKPNAQKLRNLDSDAPRRGPDPRYLQLPPVSERFQELAADITEDAETPYEKAEAIAAHMQQNFAYTTDLPKVDQNAPIESFLFETRRGHCEYFASSTVLLLRSAGVPARLVNGFLGGTWNEVGGYLGVRQGDAHSWVEVFVPHFGWAPIDPTPAADVLPVQPSPFVQWYRDVYDTMRLNWMKWVIEYDLQSQIDLFKKMGKFLAPKDSPWKQNEDEADSSSESEIDPRLLLFWAGLGLGGVGAFWSARRSSRRRQRLRIVASLVVWPGALAVWMMWFQGFETTWATAGGAIGLLSAGAGMALGMMSGSRVDSQLQALFSDLEKLGVRHGVERRPDEGPGGYLDRLGAELPGAGRDIRLFRQRYLAARFGGREPGVAQLAGLRKLVKQIKQKSSG